MFFGQDRFKPETAEGKELIAHELTHTIQQGAAVQRSEIVQRSEDVTVTQRRAEMVQRLGHQRGARLLRRQGQHHPRLPDVHASSSASTRST